MPSLLTTKISKIAAYASWLTLLFPYFRLSPNSYNQLYPLLPPIIYILSNLKSTYQFRVPAGKFFILALISIYSLGLFVVTADSISSSKWLLAVLLPIWLTPTYLSMLRKYPRKIYLIIKLSLIIWAIAGVIQLCGVQVDLFVVSPDIVSDSLISGRGASSFAPEPTHSGFTFLIIAALLANIQIPNKERSTFYLALVALAFSLVLSKSPSATLILVVSVIISIIAWLFRRIVNVLSLTVLRTSTLKNIFLLLLLPPIIYIFMLINRPTRLGSLISEFQKINLFDYSSLDSFIIALSNVDQSSGSRIGGLVFTIDQIIKSNGLPYGFGQEYWINQSQSFVVSVSANGPPSGYLSIIYYLGIFSVPLLLYFLTIGKSLILSQNSFHYKIILLSSLLVFVFQFTAASPIFSALIATCLFSLHSSRPIKSS
jgi:hypothetical protein